MRAKEQNKNSQDQINEEKIGSLPEKEFRVMIVKMIQEWTHRPRRYKKCLTKR